jgi:hypothetical protein
VTAPDEPRAPAGDLSLWLKLGVLLVLFGCWVSWWFVPQRLAPKYDRPYQVLRDRSLGQRIGVLFDLLPVRAAKSDLLVVIVGDSTVQVGMLGFFPNAGIPALLQEALARAYPGRSVGVIDMSQNGLYAPDALLFTAKAFGLDPDLVIYALTPRVIPTEPEVRWTTNVGDLALQPDIVSRLGLFQVLDLIGPRAVARTLVHSYYPPLRLRGELADQLWTALVQWSPAIGPAVRRTTGTQVTERTLGRGEVTEELPEGPVPGMPRGTYLWSAARYRLDPPTRSVRALDALVDLCRREGRCLLYHGPVNPETTGGFEPGLVDAFLARVQTRAAAGGVPLLDYRTLAAPAWFGKDLLGRPDAIHLSKFGRRQFTNRLATDAVARLGELGR